MDICTFNDHYVNPLLKNLSKEQNKKIFLMGASQQPTRIHKNTKNTQEYKKTLIDNIFCNIFQF